MLNCSVARYVSTANRQQLGGKLVDLAGSTREAVYWLPSGRKFGVACPPWTHLDPPGTQSYRVRWAAQQVHPPISPPNLNGDRPWCGFLSARGLALRK
jgi:hypothetical protein